MKVKANYDATVLQTHKKIAGDVCKVFNGLLCVNSYSNQLCAQKQLRWSEYIIISAGCDVSTCTFIFLLYFHFPYLRGKHTKTHSAKCLKQNCWVSLNVFCTSQPSSFYFIFLFFVIEGHLHLLLEIIKFLVQETWIANSGHKRKIRHKCTVWSLL